MLGCRQTAWIVLVVSLGVAGAAAGSSGDETRASVLIVALDVFSRRTAGEMEHLGTQRLDREPNWRVISTEELVLPEDSIPPMEDYQAAVKDVRQGLVDYENLELDKAVAVLSQAVDRFEKSPAVLFEGRAASYVKALIYLGASLILQGDPQRGQDAFRRLLVYDRRAKLDKSLFPPGMVGAFEAVRQEVLKGPRGSLSVFTTPSHGKVYIDGVFRGVSPCTIERLPPGRHQVVVRKVGYLVWGGMALVEPGEEQKARARLVELPKTEQLLDVINKLAAELDDDEELQGELRDLAVKGRLDRFALGKLQQRGQGVYYLVCLYELPSGRVIRSHEGVVNQAERGFAHAVDAVFSFLISGREDVLKSAKTVAVDNPALRLKDEELFEEDDTPFYKRWYFWTACGVGAASVATLLAVLLSGGEEQPKSQILLEF